MGEQASLESDLTFGDVLLHKLFDSANKVTIESCEEGDGSEDVEEEL